MIGGQSVLSFTFYNALPYHCFDDSFVCDYWWLCLQLLATKPLPTRTKKSQFNLNQWTGQWLSIKTKKLHKIAQISECLYSKVSLTFLKWLFTFYDGTIFVIKIKKGQN